MVNDADILFQAFSNDTVLIEQIDQIVRIQKKYPYYQPAWAAKTRFLKLKNTYATAQLQQTAARSIDRTLLFEYLEKPVIATEKLKDKKDKILEKKKTESVIDKINKTEEENIQYKDPKSTKLENDVSKAENQIDVPKKQVVEKPEKLSYTEWLNYFKTARTRKNKSNIDRIERFLKERPKIVPKKDISVKPPDIIEKSVAEKQMLMTETLANLYVKQKKYEKAIQAFRILSLKYPKKSSYFANQIKEIKQKLK